MAKFRKRPVIIDATQWDGRFDTPLPEGLCVDIRHGTGFAHVHTKVGQLNAQPGDWIIRGVKGDFYPCDPAIFSITYDAVEE